jgi:RNA polymerase sigma-70 factor, ECF subfamily
VTRADVPRQTERVASLGDDLVSLVERARASDPDAWEALYRRVYPGLLAYATRRLDADRARDAVAEAMARAVANIQRFAWKGGGFDAWMYGILRHVVVDAHRVRARHRGEPLDHGDGAGPLDYVLEGEEAAALRSAFDSLDTADRELLELRVVAGLSAEEVGSVLSKRPGAIRMAQSRALDRLRHELERRA